MDFQENYRDNQDRKYGQTNRQLMTQQQPQNVPYGYNNNQKDQPQSYDIQMTRNQDQIQQNYEQEQERSQRYIPPVPPHLSSSFYVQEGIQQPPYNDKDALTSPIRNNNPQAEKAINWAIYLMPILFLLASLVLMGIVLNAHQQRVQNPSESVGILQYVINNLKQSPIQDMVAITTTSADNNTSLIDVSLPHHPFHHISKKQKLPQSNPSQCPAGYQISALGQWAGVQSGCLCDDGTTHNQLFCTFHTGGTCQVISESDPINLQTWRNQSICVLMQSNWSWVGTQACAKNQTLCQPGICVTKGDPCPLTSLVEIQNPDLTQPSNYININNVSYLKMNATTNQPIIGFSVTSGISTNAPCFDSSVAPSFQSTKFYPLANQPQSGCDPSQQTTAYTQLLDTEYINQLYSQNTINTNLSSIPFYSNYIVRSDTYNLQAIQRISIGGDPACNNVNSDDMGTVLIKSTQLDSLSKWVSIVVISLCCLGLIFAIFIFMMRNRQLDTCHTQAIHQTKILYCISTVVAIFLILLGSVYINHVDTQGGLKSLHSEFQGYVTKQCFAEVPIITTIKQIDYFSYDTYSSTEGVIKTGLSISIIFIVFAVILLAVQRFKFNDELCIDPWKISEQQIL